MSYRGLGQSTITTVTRTETVPTASMSELSDAWKYGIGIGTFAVLGGLGWLAYKYPTPMLGGGSYGMQYGYGGVRPGVMLTMNRRRRKRRR